MNAQESFDFLEETVARYETGRRTKSTALLAWFLENVWRLDAEEVDDALCDGGGDKGIDAIVVNDDLMEITVLQAKRRANSQTTQGDQDLKNLVGTSVYFRTPEGIDALLDSKPNDELRALVGRLRLRERLAEGNYVVRFIFVTNSEADPAALDYLTTLGGTEPALHLWTRSSLAEVALRTAQAGVLDEEVTLTAAGDIIVHELSDDRRMALALFRAIDLAELPGIEDHTIFDPNVRLGLGQTRINRDLKRTIEDEVDRHDQFPTFHNGLTFLTHRFEPLDDRSLILRGVSVVNGCQSLLALRSSQDRLTDKLTLVTKIVEIGDDPQLAALITFRSNNQNPVDMRDQRSTDRIQRDLQAQIADKYGDRLFFSIRNGETPSAPQTLDNRLAAQLIMAVWLKEPWEAVRKVRLFDQNYFRIFNRSIDADKLLLAHQLDQLILRHREDLVPALASSFASIRFTLAYLVAQLVRQSDVGARFFDQPGLWLPEQLDAVLAKLEAFVDEVIQSVNFFVTNAAEEAAQKDEVFDPKVAFKSREGIRELEQEVTLVSRRLAMRDPTDYHFNVEPDVPPS